MKRIFGTSVTDPLYRKSGRQFYVCSKCNQLWTYLGIEKHEAACKGPRGLDKKRAKR